MYSQHIYLGSTGASFSLTQSPSVTLSNLSVVPRFASIPVTVTISPTGIPIRLQLSKLGATTAAAQFSGGVLQLTVSQTTTVNVQGVFQSSLLDDIKLEAIQVSTGQVLATRFFTVIWVTISMRNSSSQQVSTDNSARGNYNSLLGTTSLGLFFSSGVAAQLWRHGVEIIGTVAPSSFGTTTPLTTIILQRQVVATRRYNGSTLTGSAGPFADTSDSSLRDDLPQSGGSNGKVYDLDAPAFGSSSTAAQGVILRRRTNFVQWATISINGTTYPVSGEFLWFQRITVQKTATGDVIVTDVPGDNVTGVGQTKLTWNLQ